MSCPVSRTLLPSGPDFDNVVFGACGSIVVRFCGHTSFPARHLPHSTVLERRLHLAIRQPSPGGLSAHLERLSDWVLPHKDQNGLVKVLTGAWMRMSRGSPGVQGTTSQLQKKRLVRIVQWVHLA